MADLTAPVATIPDETTQRISDLTNNAVKPVTDYQATAMSGVNPTMNTDQTKANQNQLALGTNDPGTSEAIRSRYNTLLGNDLDMMQKQSKYQSYDTAAKGLQQAYGVAHAREQINLQNYARQMKAYNDSIKARSAVISTVLQTGGMIAGLALSGGTAAPLLSAAAMRAGSQAGGLTTDGASSEESAQFNTA